MDEHDWLSTLRVTTGDVVVLTMYDSDDSGGLHPPMLSDYVRRLLNSPLMVLDPDHTHGGVTRILALCGDLEVSLHPWHWKGRVLCRHEDVK